MSNFRIEFLISPWILLLLIPAVGVTVFLYLRLNKRYRNSRNRILSMVLHTIVMTLCICVLSGMRFAWTQPNMQSELVILVDASYTEETAVSRVNEFVEKFIWANNGRTNYAIVKFGYDQNVILDMGQHEPEEALKKYFETESEIDQSATDICAALNFCWNPVTEKSGGDTGKAVIHHPNEARILLLSDGLETDRDAMSVAKRIARDGIRIDSSFFPGTGMSDVWFMDVAFPEKKYAVGEPIIFDITINSTCEGEMAIILTDECENGLSGDPITQKFEIGFGTQTFQFGYRFFKPGFHTLKFELSCPGDTVKENNVFYSYYNLDELSRILVLEKYQDESKEVLEILNQKSETQYLSTTVIQIGDMDKVPSTSAALQEYDEVILVNIAHSDMDQIKGFEDALDEFVYTMGGGLFTVGGFERDALGNIIYIEKQATGEGSEAVQRLPKPHAYDEDDMKGTKYQKMLPVEITKYTPPIGLIFIIDRSASMEDDGGMGGPLDAAIKGAVATLEILNARDYVGVMTLESSSTLELSMTPITKKAQIQRAIRSVGEGSGGGTAYTPAINAAHALLATFHSVDIKHVVLISDGMPADEPSDYESAIRNLGNSGIAFTCFSIGNNVPRGLDEVCKETGGNAYRITKESIASDLPEKMYEEMKLDEFFGSVEEEYSPEINKRVSAVLSQITQKDLNEIKMKGFFSSKEKGSTKVETILKATFLPLYSQWEYGNGKVGSFMSDAIGYWSKEFFERQELGVQIICGIIDNLMPTNDIRTQNLEVTFLEDNYRTQASVYGFNQTEEKNFKLIAFVEAPSGGDGEAEIEKFDLSTLSTGGNRFTFENHISGIHKVTVLKVLSSYMDLFDGKVKGPDDVPQNVVAALNVSYRVFSYSKEYNSASDPFVEGKELLLNLSTRTIEGDDLDEKFITDIDALLSEFMEIQYQYDPRFWFIISAMVLLLLDIAIRKFRFLWPHEIIMRFKEKWTKAK